MNRLALWIRTRFVFVDGLNAKGQRVQSPEAMLRAIAAEGFFRGHCTDVSILFALMMKLIGIPVRFVAVRTRETVDGFNHVYAEAWAGEWILFDLTVEPGTPIPRFEQMMEGV